ncbi:nucleoside phosphorylase [Mucilaginibacter paludis]|uniref:Uridine phosphorylase n=1 Tax=Mucilaginibacter paludis DSM 18603 TaxID=714943 RepID=H1Y080_9SPHI|nr:nucleoside phosphorylase [Mucilaginibacter paludis]EHQ27989.1 purine or other phosphorylase family 1 [Mucilaginibacter paludis DSM 18603]
MADRIAESELIINNRGAIYHLDLRPEELATDIITVGDPDRVQQVSRYFDRVEYQRQHREFVTHTGYIGKKRISVVSTGIGTDNIDIVLNELDALVNINFETRSINTELKQLNLIRIGTSGSLQKTVPVDSFLVSTHGLGIDNLLNFYQNSASQAEQEILDAFTGQTQLNVKVSAPYISACHEGLLQHFQQGFHHGITVTCPGFYGPQGRVLRLALSNPEFIESLTHFSFGTHIISNFEMETAGLYGLGKLLGHRLISLNAIMANRITGEFSKNAQDTIDSLIVKTLGILDNI